MTNIFHSGVCALAILMSFTLLLGCRESADDHEQKEKETEQTSREKDTAVEMRDFSALSKEMIAMEQQMKWIKQHIDSNKNWPEKIFIDYHSIDTLQASDHINRKKDYSKYSNQFVEQYDRLIHEEQTQEQFTRVINSCVDCHQTYCPGPINKIKAINR